MSLDINEKKVPEVVIKRLPRYYRYLDELDKEGKTRISSTALSKKMGVTASQIRQDFNYFGGFGQQGYGYNVQYLLEELKKLLGITNGYRAIIVGAGNLGSAIANYGGLKKRGFKLLGIFDNDEKKIGKTLGGVKISDILDAGRFVKENRIDIAILTLPKNETEKIADMLADSGIKGFWNFSYTEIKCKNSVFVENVHLTDSLMTLSFKINRNCE
jgi:redox-sensing transcriptional repressor